MVKLVTRKVETIDHFATGEQARKLRTKSGKSLRVVACALGFTASYLSELERGRKNWNSDLLRRFERTLK